LLASEGCIGSGLSSILWHRMFKSLPTFDCGRACQVALDISIAPRSFKTPNERTLGDKWGGFGVLNCHAAYSLTLLPIESLECVMQLSGRTNEHSHGDCAIFLDAQNRPSPWFCRTCRAHCVRWAAPFKPTVEDLTRVVFCWIHKFVSQSQMRRPKVSLPCAILRLLLFFSLATLEQLHTHISVPFFNLALPWVGQG